jgi:hypothetical protein
MHSLRIAATVVGLTACSVKEDNTDSGTQSASAALGCDETADGDNDGLNDCAEEELGTDPMSEDTDGDGVSDLAENDCSSDPLDAADACYQCGWSKNDPGTLTSTGTGAGDVIENIAMVDQCGEEVDIWDFYGEYHILYMTAAW